MSPSASPAPHADYNNNNNALPSPQQSDNTLPLAHAQSSTSPTSFGGSQDSYSAPQLQQQQTYSQTDSTYSAPSQEQYNAPQEQYNAPQSQQIQFTGPSQAPQYNAPPAQQQPAQYQEQPQAQQANYGAPQIEYTVQEHQPYSNNNAPQQQYSNPVESYSSPDQSNYSGSSQQPTSDFSGAYIQPAIEISSSYSSQPVDHQQSLASPSASAGISQSYNPGKDTGSHDNNRVIDGNIHATTTDNDDASSTNSRNKPTPTHPKRHVDSQASIDNIPQQRRRKPNRRTNNSNKSVTPTPFLVATPSVDIKPPAPFSSPAPSPAHPPEPPSPQPSESSLPSHLEISRRPDSSESMHASVPHRHGEMSSSHEEFYHPPSMPLKRPHPPPGMRKLSPRITLSLHAHAVLLPPFHRRPPRIPLLRPTNYKPATNRNNHGFFKPKLFLPHRRKHLRINKNINKIRLSNLGSLAQPSELSSSLAYNPPSGPGNGGSSDRPALSYGTPDQVGSKDVFDVYKTLKLRGSHKGAYQQSSLQQLTGPQQTGNRPDSYNPPPNNNPNPNYGTPGSQDPFSSFVDTSPMSPTQSYDSNSNNNNYQNQGSVNPTDISFIASNDVDHQNFNNPQNPTGAAVFQSTNNYQPQISFQSSQNYQQYSAEQSIEQQPQPSPLPTFGGSCCSDFPRSSQPVPNNVVVGGLETEYGQPSNANSDHYVTSSQNLHPVYRRPSPSPTTSTPDVQSGDNENYEDSPTTTTSGKYNNNQPSRIVDDEEIVGAASSHDKPNHRHTFSSTTVAPTENTENYEYSQELAKQQDQRQIIDEQVVIDEGSVESSSKANLESYETERLIASSSTMSPMTSSNDFIATSTTYPPYTTNSHSTPTPSSSPSHSDYHIASSSTTSDPIIVPPPSPPAIVDETPKSTMRPAQRRRVHPVTIRPLGKSYLWAGKTKRKDSKFMRQRVINPFIPKFNETDVTIFSNGDQSSSSFPRPRPTVFSPIKIGTRDEDEMSNNPSKMFYTNSPFYGRNIDKPTKPVRRFPNSYFTQRTRRPTTTSTTTSTTTTPEPEHIETDNYSYKEYSKERNDELTDDINQEKQVYDVKHDIDGKGDDEISEIDKEIDEEVKSEEHVQMDKGNVHLQTDDYDFNDEQPLLDTETNHINDTATILSDSISALDTNNQTNTNLEGDDDTIEPLITNASTESINTSAEKVHPGDKSNSSSNETNPRRQIYRPWMPVRRRKIMLPRKILANPTASSNDNENTNTNSESENDSPLEFNNRTAASDNYAIASGENTGSRNLNSQNENNDNSDNNDSDNDNIGDYEKNNRPRTIIESTPVIPTSRPKLRRRPGPTFRIVTIPTSKPKELHWENYDSTTTEETTSPFTVTPRQEITDFTTERPTSSLATIKAIAMKHKPSNKPALSSLLKWRKDRFPRSTTRRPMTSPKPVVIYVHTSTVSDNSYKVEPLQYVQFTTPPPETQILSPSPQTASTEEAYSRGEDEDIIPGQNENSYEIPIASREHDSNPNQIPPSPTLPLTTTTTPKPIYSVSYAPGDSGEGDHIGEEAMFSNSHLFMPSERSLDDSDKGANSSSESTTVSSNWEPKYGFKLYLKKKWGSSEEEGLKPPTRQQLVIDKERNITMTRLAMSQAIPLNLANPVEEKYLGYSAESSQAVSFSVESNENVEQQEELIKVPMSRQNRAMKEKRRRMRRLRTMSTTPKSATDHIPGMRRSLVRTPILNKSAETSSEIIRNETVTVSEEKQQQNSNEGNDATFIRLSTRRERRRGGKSIRANFTEPVIKELQMPSSFMAAKKAQKYTQTSFFNATAVQKPTDPPIINSNTDGSDKPKNKVKQLILHDAHEVRRKNRQRLIKSRVYAIIQQQTTTLLPAPSPSKGSKK